MNRFIWRYITPASTKRFWDKVGIRGHGECWEWTATKDSNGYGVCYSGGKQVKAHRYSWVMLHRDIRDGSCVLHRCDNPCCVNPDHLFLGQPKHNIKDMVHKGRDNFWGYRDKVAS